MHNEGWKKNLAKEERVGTWLGDKVGYTGVHKWIYKKLGKPRTCSHCGSTKKNKYEWANISGKYFRKVEDYIRLCTSCHRKYDNKRKSKAKRSRETGS